MSQREILDDGSIRLTTKGCAFVYTRLRPGAVLVTITGRDTGELGSEPLDELLAEVKRYPPVNLYVDTRNATFAAAEVRDAWTNFFSVHRAHLRRVRILVGSRFLQLAIEVAKLFSRTGELIQVDADAPRFDEALAREAPAPSKPRPRTLPPRESAPRPRRLAPRCAARSSATAPSATPTTAAPTSCADFAPAPR